MSKRILIEIREKDLKMLEGADIGYVKVTCPLSKFEDEESEYRVENTIEVDSMMEFYAIPSKYKDLIEKEASDTLSYALGEDRERWINFEEIDLMLKEELDIICRKYADRNEPLICIEEEVLGYDI